MFCYGLCVVLPFRTYRLILQNTRRGPGCYAQGDHWSAVVTDWRPIKKRTGRQRQQPPAGGEDPRVGVLRRLYAEMHGLDNGELERVNRRERGHRRGEEEEEEYDDDDDPDYSPTDDDEDEFAEEIGDEEAALTLGRSSELPYTLPDAGKRAKRKSSQKGDSKRTTSSSSSSRSKSRRGSDSDPEYRDTSGKRARNAETRRQKVLADSTLAGETTFRGYKSDSPMGGASGGGPRTGNPNSCITCAAVRTGRRASLVAYVSHRSALCLLFVVLPAFLRRTAIPYLAR